MKMKKGRKLFCEISPLTYKIALMKCRMIRNVKNMLDFKKLAKHKSEEKLPYVVCLHNSLIRRKLGNVDPKLQENKAVNLSIAAPKINKVIIRPKETFSFWKLVGPCTKKRGYKEGLVVGKGSTGRDIGGGMCQFTNLIHWMILHSPLEIVEHHHHDSFDLFPDFGRQVPFGVGTSVMYNHVDYRFYNPTNITFQLITYVTDEYLCGELRASEEMDKKYHIKCENEHFTREGSDVYRNSEIYREVIDKRTGNRIERKLIKSNHAKILYDEEFVKDKIVNDNTNDIA